MPEKTSHRLTFRKSCCGANNATIDATTNGTNNATIIEELDMSDRISTMTPSSAQAGPAPGSDFEAQKKLLDTLVESLQQQGAQVRLIETHISWILLTLDIAYKFKKALRLDFLDYSTPDARRLYCHEEVRLNRRLAPDIYLGVASITGTPQQPVIDGSGPALEHAVKMRAFEQQSLWEYRVTHTLITPQEIDLLAHKLAAFYRCAARAPSASAWGTPAVIAARSSADLAVIADLLPDFDDKRVAQALMEWQASQHVALGKAFMRRKALGWIRECHGDLHCGNIITCGERVDVFDGIEFSDALRWIDVMHDLAFVWMDLQCRGRADLAARMMNRYLQLSGDYRGLAVLRYYGVQRALVRCKVALLRSRQLGGAAAAQAAIEARSYLTFAARAMAPATAATTAAIIITHGFSGSGKSTLCGALVELLGAVQVRSDIERKRLHAIAPDQKAAAGPGAGIYGMRASRACYLRIRRLARDIAIAGMPVIVDAAFLQRAQRIQLQQLAQELDVPFFIIDVHANLATLRARVVEREQRGNDVSDAGLGVLEHQLATHEPLGTDELPYVIKVDSERAMDSAQMRLTFSTLVELVVGPAT
jgi:aminoglycoside phosphotransferase family enzyme/predicted kinase